MEKQGAALYLECASGISGDMAVAALLDLGADREVLEKALRSLPIHGFRIEINRVKKAGLDVCDFQVLLEEEYENYDHDMEYLFGDKHGREKRHGENCHGENDEGEHCHGEHHHGESCHEEHRYEKNGHGENGHEENHHGESCHEEHNHGEHHHGENGHGEHHHEWHEHRNLTEILHIIEHTDMTAGAKETARRIFKILAAAEAKAHGLPEEEVHFHEVGAVDSIVDIVSVAVCLDDLGVTKCIVPALCEGSGTVRCQHGILSVPVPAVLNIMEAYRINLSITDIKGELVTPTGAAIVAAIRTADELPKRFRVIKTGMGGGKREYERPSILRAMLIEDLSDFSDQREAEGIPVGENKEKGNDSRDCGKKNERKAETDTVNGNDGNVENIENKQNKADGDVIYKLETTIDDCSGEVLGYVLERLLQAGAKDAHYLPVYMKKNRPAYQLNVICEEERIPVLENIIFAETTTIGIRRQRMERSVLSRRNMEVLTELGNAKVKECRLPESGEVRYYPEYESVVRLCRSSGKPFREVYRLIIEECKK